MNPAIRARRFRRFHPGASLFLVLSIALLSGCGTAGQGPFRTGRPGEGAIVETFPNATEPRYTHDFKVGYIEFDDQGWLWSQRDSDKLPGSQLEEVERLIMHEANLRSDGHQANGIILIAFIHGWMNNAARDNANVASFKSLLNQISAEQANLGAAKRPVVGVYIGWPGLTAPEPFSVATFYSRKNAADRVGYYSGVTQVLCTLEALHTRINRSLAPGKPRNCFVTAGHSFGAQVAYNAVTTILMERLADVCVDEEVSAETTSPAGVTEGRPRAALTRSTNRVVKPFGDLVLLVNPAFEAARYENLWRLARELRYPNNAQRPVFAIFSSDTDRATQLAFPLGRYTSTLFERYRDDNLADEQRDANHHTIPWTDRYITHTLRKSGDPATEPIRAEAANLRANGADSNTPEWVGAVIRNWNRDTRAGTLDLANCVLTPKNPDPARWTPFYVVRVRKTLMDGHSDIWRDDFRDFLVKFLTTANPPFRE